MAGTTTANIKKIGHSDRAYDAEVEDRIFVAHSLTGSLRAIIPNIVDKLRFIFDGASRRLIIEPYPWASAGSPLPLRLSLGFSAGALAVPTLVCILMLMEEHGAARIPKGISPAAIGSIILILVLLSLISYAASRNSSHRSLKRKFLAANIYAQFMSFWFLINLH